MDLAAPESVRAMISKKIDALEEEALETAELILRAEEVEEHRVLSLRVKLKPKLSSTA